MPLARALVRSISKQLPQSGLKTGHPWGYLRLEKESQHLAKQTDWDSSCR